MVADVAFEQNSALFLWQVMARTRTVRKLNCVIMDNTSDTTIIESATDLRREHSVTHERRPPSHSTNAKPCSSTQILRDGHSPHHRRHSLAMLRSSPKPGLTIRCFAAAVKLRRLRGNVTCMTGPPPAVLASWFWFILLSLARDEVRAKIVSWQNPLFDLKGADDGQSTTAAIRIPQA